MNDDLISLYIDDEMSLDNKIQFVETVHESKVYADSTIELLHQEKILTADMVTQIPALETKAPHFTFSYWLRPIAAFSMALAIFAIVWFRYDVPGMIFDPELTVKPAGVMKVPYRFVIYHPAANQAEIIGTFTNWQPVIMEHSGSSGYWTITLNLSEGEHRYSYRVEGGQQMADPTVRSREADDFGGENSIIVVKRSI